MCLTKGTKGAMKWEKCFRKYYGFKIQEVSVAPKDCCVLVSNKTLQRSSEINIKKKLIDMVHANKIPWIKNKQTE